MMAARGMQQTETSDYINERPQPEQKCSGDAPQTERKLCHLLLISFGLLCIIQAVLNISLRLTLYSSKESIHFNCNTTQSTDQNQVKVPQVCEQRTNGQCNALQERFNALTREKKLLENDISELSNVIRNLEKERITMEKELKVLRSCQQCPTDWRKINNRCYFLSIETKTWEGSRKYCQGKDSDLVVINSIEEQTALYRLDGDAHLLFWIGLNRTTGNFKWVDGSGLNRVFWYSSPPDYGSVDNREECVGMDHFTPLLHSWHEAPCGQKQRWLCEKGLQSS